MPPSSIGIPWSDRLGRSISVTASSLVMPEALQYLFKHSRNEFVIHNTVHVETIFQGITVTPKLQFSKTGLPFTLVSLGVSAAYRRSSEITLPRRAFL
ncbi:hypothetical protein PISMIDRAFT_199407 [Pisolithus microcarpus 441]|uniref:Uncharacterized protein n=1 Tax=Pisolithus microcarpus 441 TaxID=765257 RepID=A0A0D0A513_9AGAM|nr:hypothetical protein PISMIDRAFT_199407 [Pisolithus microcarpus 441]